MCQAETVAHFTSGKMVRAHVFSATLRATWCTNSDCQNERVELVPDYKPRPGFPNEEHA